ncbi:MAG: imidazolonepropionase-like amidohydrolase [Candidatus Paceibacteria bacterium]|jgi:imidazolonepropionase-like amidohydrolase
MFSSLLISLAVAGSPAAPASDLVAIQAGTIYVAAEDRVLRDGATLLIRDGKIVGVGKTDELPAGVRVVDYGPDAVIIPGLVAVSSGLGSSRASERSAEPALSAVDQFDLYGSYASILASGVTTAYIAPAQGRLIAGNGAVVKLAGQPGTDRVLARAASIHGSISEDARSTPGYWQPPVPATVDVGLGVERAQLPRTTMGAIVALRELLDLAASPADTEEYGPYAGSDLAKLMKAETTWRMRAESAGEVRALVSFFKENNLPLVLDGASAGSDLAELLAEAKIPVVVYSNARTNSSPRDRGKSEGAQWPDAELASKLDAAGALIAVAQARGYSVRDLRFNASLARRGGLSSGTALRSITSNAAAILGVSDRVGSLTSGLDADLVVLNGDPLSTSSSVIATWVDGEVVYKADESESVVIEVDELFLGNGQVLSPGQLLMQDGEIVEVGRRVSHPQRCTVVRGSAAMPGMIDALGHLGLEGSAKVPKTGFKLGQLIEPGDFADRRVAQAGVTTVVMTPRGSSGSGAPAMAYKPAGTDIDSMVIADPAAIHLTWSNSNRLDAGKSVKSVLEKGYEYKAQWDAYEKAILTYTPPAPEADADSDEEEGEAADEEEEEAEKTPAKKKKKKKKKGEEPPKPVTGVWLAQIEQEGGDSLRLRIQVQQDATGGLKARLRCDAVSADLVSMEGTREEHSVTLTGNGSNGEVTLSAETKEGKLVGKLVGGGAEHEFSATQDSKEVVVAGRTQAYEPAEEIAKAPKGAPKIPRMDPDLEPIRAALEGRGTFVVSVERSDEIVACVDAFAGYRVKPVLRGADDAWKVADKIVGRVRGVLLDHRVIYSDARMGLGQRNRYAELMNAGIDVAFHSGVEEGAAELPLLAAYAVSQGMSPTGAIEALTSGAARMMSIDDRVGTLRAGMDADVLLLDGSPLEAETQVQRVWVNGREVRLH